LSENSWQRQLNNFSLSLSPLDLVADDPLEVHIQVNVALRAKLAEEIKENTVKVKVNSLLEICMSYSFSLLAFDQTTCMECIEVLAAVCETTSLATLTLYFPPEKVWQCEVLNVRATFFYVCTIA